MSAEPRVAAYRGDDDVWRPVPTLAVPTRVDTYHHAEPPGVHKGATSHDDD